MGSLTVLKIEKIKNERILHLDNTSLEKLQTKLPDFGLDEIRELGNAVTNLKKSYVEGGVVVYEVKMSSDTIKRPIYIYDEEYTEWTDGYQTIDKFSIWINPATSRLYIFAQKSLVDLFVQRLKKSGYFIFSNLTLDFSRVSELTNLESSWGVWENSEGIVTRIGKFGKGINEIIDDYSRITTFYIDYNYHGEVIQLILGSNGRVSTMKNLTNRELANIYDEISTVLIPF